MEENVTDRVGGGLTEPFSDSKGPPANPCPRPPAAPQNLNSLRTVTAYSPPPFMVPNDAPNITATKQLPGKWSHHQQEHHFTRTCGENAPVKQEIGVVNK